MDWNAAWTWFTTSCGTVCDVLLGKYPGAYSIIGLCIVLLIFLRLRRINNFVEEMHKEANELKQMARFPYCDECPYKDVCQKRIDSIDECTYEHRKSMASS